MKRLLWIACGLLWLLSGCAYIGAISAAVLLSQEEEEELPNIPPVAFSLTAVAVSPIDTVTLHYALQDLNADPAHVTVEYSADGGANFAACTELVGSGSEGTTFLPASPEWTDHVFAWDAPVDLAGYNQSIILRIIPTDSLSGALGTSHTFSPFIWRPNTGPEAAVSDPGPSSNRVSVSFILKDPESNPADVVFEYSTDGGSTFFPATLALGMESEALFNLATSPTGSPHEFLWNAFHDVGGIDTVIRLRITPSDAVSQAAGVPGLSPPFPLTNSLVCTVAGRGTLAFGTLASVAADTRGVVYFTEQYGHRIYAFNTASTPLQAAGRTVFPGQLKCIAGTGTAGYNGDHLPALNAQLNLPSGLAVETGSPPTLFVADTMNHRIRRIDGNTGFISTLTGDGTPGINDGVPAAQGQVNGPRDVACDALGNVFIADTENHIIRAVNRGVQALGVGWSVVPPGTILRVCGAPHILNPTLGDGGFAASARLDRPSGITFDGRGNLLIGDTNQHRIRAFNTADPNLGPAPTAFGNITILAGNIDTLAGSGAQGFGGDGGPAVGGTVLLDSPEGLAWMSPGVLLFADRGNHTVRAVHTGTSAASPLSVGSVTLQGGWIDTVVGTGQTPGSSGNGGIATASRLNAPNDVAPVSGAILVADGGNRTLRLFNPSPASSSTPLSLGHVTVDPAEIEMFAASVGYPLLAPTALAAWGNDLFIADAQNHRILNLNPQTGRIVPLAGDGVPAFGGDGGPALSASFSAPSGLAVDGISGQILLIADTGNNRIRMVHFDIATGNPVTAFGDTVNAGEVKTILSTVGSVSSPTGIAIGPNGDLFIADTGGNRILHVARTGGALTPVAGSGAPGYGDGALVTAQFDGPEGIVVTPSWVAYVADTGNHAVRLVNLGTIPIVYGSGPSQITVGPSQVGTLGGLPPNMGYDGDGREAWLSWLNAPAGIAVNSAGTVTFSERGNHRIRRIQGGGGTLSTLAGAGTSGFNGDGLPLLEAQFNGPEGVWIDGAGNHYLADRNNGRIRRFRVP
ncbi:MAG: NHL domain-containing protein [Planctomycetota bacterium]|jgi:sugar lactone lactonase YvrE